MKALIVDDEPIARKVLKEQLEDFPDVVIVGEAASGAEALDKIARLAPDLLLLDLQMPEIDGLAVARALPAAGAPLVIYVTAYKTHALDAFDTGAVDYLLKPVRQERLAAALDKARTQLAGRVSAAAPVASPRPEAPWRIVGRLGKDFHLIDPADVVAFQADGDLVYIVSRAWPLLCERNAEGPGTKTSRQPLQESSPGDHHQHRPHSQSLATQQ